MKAIMINKNKHYCKYLDAGMDGMLCKKKAFFGKCDYYDVSDDKDNHCKMFRPKPNEYDKICEKVRRETAKEILQKVYCIFNYCSLNKVAELDFFKIVNEYRLKLIDIKD